MSLLCAFGFHRPGARTFFNAGIGFSACARCGRDIVRGANGRWAVPRGARIVWKTKSEAAYDVLLHSGDEAGIQRRRRPATELPIQEVLRHLKTPDFMAEEPEEAPWEASIEVPVDAALDRLDTADFMMRRPSDVRLRRPEPSAPPVADDPLPPPPPEAGDVPHGRSANGPRSR
ncbi:MAG TPA: hypothetical protein VF727_08345 [Allosphingosinicella sp.]|jgi:hypothetical protein